MPGYLRCVRRAVLVRAEHVVAATIRDVARARGMMQWAHETGLAREGPYKAFGANGNPSFATIMKVARALGVKLAAQPAWPLLTA